MIVVRQDTARLAARLPNIWRTLQHAWLDAMADVFSAPTPEARHRAMHAMQQAKRALPHVDLDDTTTEALIAKRMNRLMHFTELMLKDDTLPLWQTSAAANGASA